MIKPKIPEQKLSQVRSLRRRATPQEIIVWSRLRGRRFYNIKFRRQYSLGRFIVDFVSLETRLIIEVDGWQHGENSQKHYDEKREKYLESLGFRILRFWNNEVNENLEGVFLKIVEVIEASKFPHPNPLPEGEGGKAERPCSTGREKQIKGGSRTKKITLIKSINPQWEDLIF